LNADETRIPDWGGEVSEEVSRAELHLLHQGQQTAKPTVLLLCPGFSGDGSAMAAEKPWMDFAKKNDFWLVGLSFASPSAVAVKKRGYYYASSGSHQQTLSGLRELTGSTDVNVYLVGFSGGAHFAARFARSYPDETIGFAALGAGKLGNASLPSSFTIKAMHWPASLIGCGELDGRLSGAFQYFAEAREDGIRSAWVEVPNAAHTRSLEFETLARSHLLGLLDAKTTGYYRYRGISPVVPPTHTQFPSLFDWFPSMAAGQQAVQLGLTPSQSSSKKD